MHPVITAALSCQSSLLTGFRSRFTLAAALVFTAGIPLFSQAAGLGPAATAIPAPDPSLSSAPAAAPKDAPILPVSEVHAGQEGVAYTVFEGGLPEPMTLRILGVLHNSNGPRQDVILARLTGSKAEYTGVVAGMSGSPVYIDGKLVGALAFRIGTFSKEPIAGITPIGQMLDIRSEQLAPGSEAVSTLSSPSFSNSEPSNLRTPPSSPNAKDSEESLHPIETPLIFSGYSAEAVRAFQDRFAALNLTPEAGLGGSSSQATLPAIVPGSAVSAQMVRGDLEVAATCTVTWVDATNLLACGHPITQFGPISMPMTATEVIATLASPLNAFKIVSTGNNIGSFVQDRHSGVLGRFGASAEMIPVTVSLAGVSKPTAYHFEVLKNAQLTPNLVMVSVFEILNEVNSFGSEVTYRMRGSLSFLGNHQPLTVDALFSPTEGLPGGISAALGIGERFSHIFDNPAGTPQIRQLDLNFDVIPGRRSVLLKSARSSRAEVRAGDDVTLDLTLQPYAGETFQKQIMVKLPPGLPAGSIRLLVSDGAGADRLMQPGGFGARPLDLDATISSLNQQHPNDRLYVTLLSPQPQGVFEDKRMPDLPLSVANVLEPLRSSRELTLSSESAIPLGELALDAVPTGSEIITLTVKSP